MTNSSQRLTFNTHDGLTLVADAWGDPCNPPVIFAHGGGQTRHSWGGAAQRMAQRGWYAIAFDLRGHGDSDWCPSGNYLRDDYAQDIVTIAATLDKAPALVGASLGGISMLVAQGETKAQLGSSLILVDVTPRMEESGVDRILSFMRANVNEGFANLEEAAQAVASYMPERPKPKSTAGLEKNLRLGDDGRYRWHWDPKFINGKKSASDNGVLDRLEHAAENLTIPTLLVRGQMSDLVSEEAAQEFLKLTPHAKFVDVKDAGHMVAGDKNDIFADAVFEFLACA